jgi:hypothetical protein
MKFLPRAFAAIAAIGVACGAAAANDPAAAMANVSALPAQPSMYSFADVYRLTVAGPATADNPLAALAALAGAAASDASSARLPKSAASVDYQLRVVSSEAQAPVRQLFPAATAAPVQSSYMFSIGAMPQPERWLLILSGLAAAAWVARRRLGNSF